MAFGNQFVQSQFDSCASVVMLHDPRQLDYRTEQERPYLSVPRARIVPFVGLVTGDDQDLGVLARSEDVLSLVGEKRPIRLREKGEGDGSVGENVMEEICCLISHCAVGG